MIKETIKELDLDSFSIRMEPRNHKPYKRGEERIPYGTGPYTKKNKQISNDWTITYNDIDWVNLYREKIK